MARNKKELGKGGNWMDTYGDMVTLLLTFFVCLYSMATMSDEKWYELVQAFNIRGSEKVDQIVFAVTDQEGKAVKETMAASDFEGSTHQTEGPKDSEDVLLENLYNWLKDNIKKTEWADSILIENGQEEQDDDTSPPNDNTSTSEDAATVSSPIYMQLNNAILFEPDKAVLLKSSYDPLGVIADAIIQYQDSIGVVVIKGFTADIESHADAWTLSGERALEVFNYMRYTKNFDPGKMRYMALGNLFPVASNDTEEERAKNRRIEIVIIPKSLLDSQDDFGSYFSTKDTTQALLN